VSQASTVSLSLDAAPDAPVEEVPPFREAYRRHAPLVWRVLRRLGVPPADTEDVAQDVFTVVYRKLPGFAGRSTLRTWICGIAVKRALDYRRRGHVRREVATATPVEQVADAPQLAAVERREARACLDHLISELDEEKRVVFVLYEIEELTMAEVAEAAGCPLQTAYTRLHTARRQVEAAVARLQLRGDFR
jgi:RNA polymerase sigma-70 factor (ECF subfamily)